MNELSIFDSLFNDLMDAGTTAYAFNAPRVDVKEADNAYTLEMELPGRTENDINIELNRNNLIIASKEEKKSEDKKQRFLLRERRNNSFNRKFTLPEDVDTDSISANFKNGLLIVNMQKKTNTAPKTIAIQAC